MKKSGEVWVCLWAEEIYCCRSEDVELVCLGVPDSMMMV